MPGAHLVVTSYTHEWTDGCKPFEGSLDEGIHGSGLSHRCVSPKVKAQTPCSVKQYTVAVSPTLIESKKHYHFYLLIWCRQQPSSIKLEIAREFVNITINNCGPITEPRWTLLGTAASSETTSLMWNWNDRFARKLWTQPTTWKYNPVVYNIEGFIKA